MVKNDTYEVPAQESSFALIPKSIRLAIKNYDRIAFFYLIPFLIALLALRLGGINSLNQLSSKGIEVFYTHLTTRLLIAESLYLVVILISLINFPATIYFRIESVRNGVSPSIADCYKRALRLWPKLIAVEIVSTVIIFAGFLAFILPGIWLFRCLWLSPYYAIDNPNLSIYQILQKSRLETLPDQIYVYTTAGVVLVVSIILHALAFNLVGVLISTILSYGILFLPALRYQEISGNQIKAAKKL